MFDNCRINFIKMFKKPLHFEKKSVILIVAYQFGISGGEGFAQH